MLTSGKASWGLYKVATSKDHIMIDPAGTRLVAAFSIGYFLEDFQHVWRQVLSSPAMSLHHILGIGTQAFGFLIPKLMQFGPLWFIIEASVTAAQL